MARWNTALALGQTAKALAIVTEDAYSFARYGHNVWAACYARLLQRGYNTIEAQAIMRSKLTRIAGDHRQGQRITSCDLTRLLDSIEPTELRALVDDYVIGIFGPDEDEPTPAPTAPALRLVWSRQ